MTIDVSTSGFDNPGRLSELTARRLRLVLGRFAGRVRRVSAVVSDVNGPRGGVDCEVRVEVRLQGAADVRVRHLAATQGEAVARAGDRVRRAVRRSLDRAARRRPPRPEVAAAG